MSDEPSASLPSKAGQTGPQIRVFEPLIAAEDVAAVTAATQSGWISGASPAVRDFERAFSEFVGAAGGSATCNGTAALEVALLSLGVGPGDEVICPSLTIISCARAILAVGASPVLVDVCPDRWVIDSKRVQAAITPRTRAILGVHLFGNPCDVFRGRWPGIASLEDAAQAIGSEVFAEGRWKRCGSLGDAAAFSFYANKVITTGEGGMVTASDPEVADHARRATNMYFGRGDSRFVHESLGPNARMSGVLAALGLSQLNRVEEVLDAKRRVAATYQALLDEISGVRCAQAREHTRPVPWMMAVTLDGTPSEPVAAFMAHRGIETRPFFQGLHRQPCLQGRFKAAGTFDVTESLTRHGLILPSSPTLAAEDIQRVVSTLREGMREALGGGTP